VCYSSCFPCLKGYEGMALDGIGKVCPYCNGKRHVVVLMDSNRGDDLDGKTWVSEDCPLCEGSGWVYGENDSTDSKDSLD
jgi:hypothetical protein